MHESRVLALLEGRLEGTALADVEAHLTECEDCVLLVGAAANGLESASEGTPSAVVRDAPASLHARYELVDFIAEGGMGEVYEAIDRHTGQRVAIKTLKDCEGAQGQ